VGQFLTPKETLLQGLMNLAGAPAEYRQAMQAAQMQAQAQAQRLQQAEARKKKEQELKELREHVHDEVVNAAAVSAHLCSRKLLEHIRDIAMTGERTLGAASQG
jgi:F0F1-type ATP synthase membrane subunit b/b'